MDRPAIEDALRSAEVRMRAGGVEEASGALSALEKELTAGGDRCALAIACAGHARLLLEASERTGLRAPTLDWRERALRKANRALRIAEDVGDRALVVESTRAHVAALRSIPGRLGQALERARELVAMLESWPGDTRLERARLLADRGAMRVPWGNGDERARFRRDEGAESEAAYRAALELYAEVGDRCAPEIAQTIAALAYLHEMCGAFTAIDALVEEAGRTMPRAAAAALRAQASGWDEETRVTRAMRAIAERIEARDGSVAHAARDEVRGRTVAVGGAVRHAKLGRGVVIAVHPGEREIAEVRFEDGSTRKLLARVLEPDG